MSLEVSSFLCRVSFAPVCQRPLRARVELRASKLALVAVTVAFQMWPPGG
jgi:hypothetical protein